jgi:glycosyltransferase involved in cell wall biosynthesis
MCLLKNEVRIPLRLRLIGGGPDEQRLKLLASELGIRKSVDFIGPVPHDSVPRWLAKSDICVHVTNDMCTGVKVAEYMAAGKPTVISAPWSNRYDEFLQNGVNCILVPLEAKELAQAIEKLLSSRKAGQIATNGFKTVMPWTWDNIARKKMELIQQLF